MKISELIKQLESCSKQWGDIPVHLMDLNDDGSEEIESVEYDGTKIILGDLTRSLDNNMNSLCDGEVWDEEGV